MRHLHPNFLTKISPTEGFYPKHNILGRFRAQYGLQIASLQNPKLL
jgi:hypothetical protein